MKKNLLIQLIEFAAFGSGLMLVSLYILGYGYVIGVTNSLGLDSSLFQYSLDEYAMMGYTALFVVSPYIPTQVSTIFVYFGVFVLILIFDYLTGDENIVITFDRWLIKINVWIYRISYQEGVKSTSEYRHFMRRILRGARGVSRRVFLKSKKSYRKNHKFIDVTNRLVKITYIFIALLFGFVMPAGMFLSSESLGYNQGKNFLVNDHIVTLEVGHKIINGAYVISSPTGIALRNEKNKITFYPYNSIIKISGTVNKVLGLFAR